MGHSPYLNLNLCGFDRTLAGLIARPPATMRSASPGPRKAFSLLPPPPVSPKRWAISHVAFSLLACPVLCPLLVSCGRSSPKCQPSVKTQPKYRLPCSARPHQNCAPRVTSRSSSPSSQLSLGPSLSRWAPGQRDWPGICARRTHRAQTGTSGTCEEGRSDQGNGELFCPHERQ